MTKPRTRNPLFFLLVFFLPAFLLIACDDPTCPVCGPGGGEGPQTVDLSGKVIDLASTATPPAIAVAGAKVELVGGTQSTTTGGDGTWTLADVPTPDEDPLILITADGYAPSYNSFPVSLLIGSDEDGLLQYDLLAIDENTFGGLPYLMGGPLPANGCLVVGLVVGFISTDYPQQVAQLAGATITETSHDYDVVYFNATGLPQLDLTETSASGTFGIVVPDATAVTSIALSGTRAGLPLTPPESTPVFPDSFVLTGVIDFNYTP